MLYYKLVAVYDSPLLNSDELQILENYEKGKRVFEGYLSKKILPTFSLLNLKS